MILSIHYSLNNSGVMYLHKLYTRYSTSFGERESRPFREEPETFISILTSTTPMHLEPFVMHSALPARPQPLVRSLQLVKVWPYREEEDNVTKHRTAYTALRVDVLDPEIDRVDLWRSIWGKYRSTRSIDSTFGPSHDSARLSTTAIDSIDLTDFILDSMYFPRFLADRTNGGAYATVVFRPSPSVIIVVSELWINDAS